MRVHAVNLASDICRAKKNSILHSEPANKFLPEQDTFNKQQTGISTLSFKGYNVHIIDGGLHADTMVHFARGITKKMDDVVEVMLRKTQTNPFHPGLKQVSSIRDNLKLLNEQEIAKPGDYVAITGSAQVYLNDLAERMELKPFTIRPDNVKNFKSDILQFMSDKYNSSRLDVNCQDLYAVPEAINQINALVKKGVNVYMPAGHPIEFTLKAKAAENGVKDDLYKMIYTRGKEGSESINPIIKEIKDENIYKFNLLALSDAHVVNARDLSDEKDYIFAAYDSCVNDHARGVYNFYPVRNREGVVLGYSFTDKRTIHYPYYEYPGNEHIAEISKFVGRKMEDFSYEGNIIKIMSRLIGWEEPHDKLPDVLYPITCYPRKRLKEENLWEKGLFFNRTETLFFGMNDSHEFTFPKCDCEGSGRPSVVPMWGSCFATIKAIKRDIATAISRKIPSFNRYRDYLPAEKLLKEAEANMREGKLKTAEYQLNKITKSLEPYKDISDTFAINVRANKLLYRILTHQHKDAAAEGVANRAINLQSRILLYHFNHADCIHDFNRLRTAEYWDFPEAEAKALTEEAEDIASWFNEITHLCRKKGNDHTAEVASWANSMISSQHPMADALITRRANGHINIGELYNEYIEHYSI